MSQCPVGTRDVKVEMSIQMKETKVRNAVVDSIMADDRIFTSLGIDVMFSDRFNHNADY